MRYIRIFLLHFQDTLEHRSQAFVWFLLSLVNPLVYLLFWKAAIVNQSIAGSFVSLNFIASYYFLFLIAGSLLIAHIEEDVSYWDIKQGGLVKYLLKPYSYFWMKLYLEIPWRITMTIFSAISLLLFAGIFGNFFEIKMTFSILFPIILMCFLGFAISYVFKMIIGIITFWIIDYGGLHQLVMVATLIFAGFVMPIDFYSPVLKSITLWTPFPYMIYYPVIAALGRLEAVEIYRVLFYQILWVVLLAVVYKQLWKQGVKKFTGIGQ